MNKVWQSQRTVESWSSPAPFLEQKYGGVFMASSEDTIKNLDTYGQDFGQLADPRQLR